MYRKSIESKKRRFRNYNCEVFFLFGMAGLGQAQARHFGVFWERFDWAVLGWRIWDRHKVATA